MPQWLIVYSLSEKIEAILLPAALCYKVNREEEKKEEEEEEKKEQEEEEEEEEEGN